MALEPIFERDFAEHSYGFRPGRGCKDALRRVDQLLKEGYTYIVDADLKSYFDTIPHDRLMALRGSEGVGRARAEPDRECFSSKASWTACESGHPKRGRRKAAVISPLLSNIYLDPLDHLMAQQGFEMVRYADDFVILCRSPEDAAQALAMVQEWTAEAGLTLHPEKTKIVDATKEAFDFLGYRFVRGQRFPRPKSLQKLKDAIRAKTKRTSGESLTKIINDLTPRLRGWFEYFKHSHRFTFNTLDGWIRMRLRSHPPQTPGPKRDVAAGAIISVGPTNSLPEHGFYSLKTAHELACQSSSR